MLKQYARGMHSQARRFHFMSVGRSGSTVSGTALSPFDTSPGTARVPKSWPCIGTGSVLTTKTKGAV